MSLRSPKRILLVEDNGLDALMIEEMLMRDARGQFDLSRTGSLRDALEKTAGEDFDAVLLDPFLPDSRGLDTIRQLCAALPAMPILVFTDSADEQIVVEAVHCGAEDCLVKGQADGRFMARAITYATDRKQVAERQRENEAKLRAAFDQASHFIAILATDGTLVMVNRPALDFICATESDVCGKPFWETPWATHSPGLPGKFRTAVETAAAGHCAGFELVRPGPDGMLRHIDVSIRPAVVENGHVPYLIAEGLDITEQKRAEEALLQSEKERAEAEKLAVTGRMAARIAHEIDNPLAGIANAFRLFRNAVPKDCPEYCFVERTEQEIQRVARIIRLMYDLHRPNQEREADVQIDETVREVVMMLEPLCRQYAARVEIASPAPAIRAYVPEGSLRQILFALVTNAIEASPPDGVVRIGLAADSQALVLSISDEGGGIPDDLRDRIFEPFFSTKTGKGNEGGLGLGLSTAKQLAELLRGRLEYESKAGMGTVFRVRLPLARIKGVVL